MIPCGTCEGCRTIGPFHCRSYGFLGSRNDGGFAEYCLAPEANLIPLPPELDARAGALIEPIAVALHAVRRARFEAGMSALVYGAGPIGLLIAFWLRTLEAKRVQLADVRKESLVLAKEMGVTDVFDPSQKTSRGPADADVVFEAAGSQAALRHAIERTASKGSIMLIGRDTRDTLLPVSSVERLMRKEVSLLGCWGYDLRGEELFLQRVLAQTSIPIARLITHEIGLEEAPSFIPKMLEKRIYYGKVLLRIAPERT
jgi:L-iditol 2-dehydrogenase